MAFIIDWRLLFLLMVFTVSKETIRKVARSGSMVCPICNLKRALVEHHIHGRGIPNSEASWNKAWICAACHDDVHSGRLEIEGWVMTTEGKVLVSRKAGALQEVMEAAKPRLYSDNGAVAGLGASSCNTEGIKCPYCGAKAKRVNRSFVNGDMMDTESVFVCEHYPSCDAYVGCYPGTDKPLGTLADGELRSWRMRAHGSLDWTWQHGGMTRNEAYVILRDEMGLSEDEAHIGKMDIDGCKRVVDIFNALRPWKVPKRS